MNRFIQSFSYFQFDHSTSFNTHCIFSIAASTSTSTSESLPDATNTPDSFSAGVYSNIFPYHILTRLPKSSPRVCSSENPEISQKSKDLYSRAKMILSEGPASVPFAKKLLLEAAALGNPDAMFELGNTHLSRDQIHTSFTLNSKTFTPLELIEKAAAMNHPPSLFLLGDINLTGSSLLNVERNRVAAVKYFERAAEYDFTPALSILGNIYSTDLLFEPDLEKSIDYLSRSSTIEAIEAHPKWASLSLCSLARIILNQQTDQPNVSKEELQARHETILSLLAASTLLDNSLATVLLADYIVSADGRNGLMSEEEIKKYTKFSIKQLYYRAYLLGSDLAEAKLQKMGVSVQYLNDISKKQIDLLKPAFKSVYREFHPEEPEKETPLDDMNQPIEDQ